MANKVWIAKQQHRAQQDEIVLASGISGVTYSVTINGKTISFTTSGTVAAPGITSGLLSGLIASDEPEFQEITWTGFGSGLRATAVEAGKPFTYSIAVTAGGFMETSGVVSNLSPSDVADGTNWDTSGIPATGDDVYFDGRVQTPALWRLDQLSGIQFNTLELAAAYGLNDAQIGLQETDEDGGYPQYRPIYLVCGATVTNIGRGPGPGIRLCKINNLTSGLEYNIFRTGTAKELNREAVTIKGTNTSGRANIYNGSTGFAVLAGESARLITLNIGPAGGGSPRVQLGFGVDMASGTLNFNNGQLILNGRINTLNHKAGNGSITGSGTILALNIQGGTLVHQGTGPIGTITIGTPGTLNLGDAGPSLVISGAVTMAAQTQLLDRGFRGTYASGIVLQNCTTTDVVIDLGPSRTLKPS